MEMNKFFPAEIKFRLAIFSYLVSIAFLFFIALIGYTLTHAQSAPNITGIYNEGSNLIVDCYNCLGPNKASNTGTLNKRGGTSASVNITVKNPSDSGDEGGKITVPDSLGAKYADYLQLCTSSGCSNFIYVSAGATKAGDIKVNPQTGQSEYVKTPPPAEIAQTLPTCTLRLVTDNPAGQSVTNGETLDVIEGEAVSASLTLSAEPPSTITLPKIDWGDGEIQQMQLTSDKTNYTAVNNGLRDIGYRRVTVNYPYCSNEAVVFIRRQSNLAAPKPPEAKLSELKLDQDLEAEEKRTIKLQVTDIYDSPQAAEKAANPQKYTNDPADFPTWTDNQCGSGFVNFHPRCKVFNVKDKKDGNLILEAEGSSSDSGYWSFTKESTGWLCVRYISNKPNRWDVKCTQVFESATYQAQGSSGGTPSISAELKRNPQSQYYATVKWSAIRNTKPTDWFGVYAPGDPDSVQGNKPQAPKGWLYVSCKDPDIGHEFGQCDFDLSKLPNGTYEFRLFSEDGFTKLATSSQFTIPQGSSTGGRDTSKAPQGEIHFSNGKSAAALVERSFSKTQKEIFLDYMGLLLQNLKIASNNQAIEFAEIQFTKTTNNCGDKNTTDSSCIINSLRLSDINDLRDRAVGWAVEPFKDLQPGRYNIFLHLVSRGAEPLQDRMCSGDPKRIEAYGQPNIPQAVKRCDQNNIKDYLTLEILPASSQPTTNPPTGSISFLSSQGAVLSDRTMTVAIGTQVKVKTSSVEAVTGKNLKWVRIHQFLCTTNDSCPFPAVGDPSLLKESNLSQNSAPDLEASALTSTPGIYRIYVAAADERECTGDTRRFIPPCSQNDHLKLIVTSSLASTPEASISFSGLGQTQISRKVNELSTNPIPLITYTVNGKDFNLSSGSVWYQKKDSSRWINLQETTSSSSNNFNPSRFTDSVRFTPPAETATYDLIVEGVGVNGRKCSGDLTLQRSSNPVCSNQGKIRVIITPATSQHN